MSNLFSTGGAGNVGFSGEVQQSLKFNDDESQYLSRTFSAGNRQTWTWSAWVKRGTLGVAQILFGTQADGSNVGHISFQADDTIKVNNKASDSTGDETKTVMVFRDASAWYHIVIAFDGAQSTQADRTTFYVNGVEQSRTTVASKSAGNGYINTAVEHTVGTRGQLLGAYFDGYLSDINFIDGQALDPTSFGETVNGYWKAKDYAGTYGTNGFHLTFADDVVSEGFNAVTYTGTGVTNSVSGLGFSPDLVWIKGRNIAYNHRIYDTVRGVNKRLYSDLTNGEYTSTQSVMSFDADGFTLGTDAGENNGTTPGSFVAWAWDAGSGSAASNTDGTITSTVKANPAYGFSIVSYTGNATSGATVGHGIATPEMIIVKDRDAAQSWRVYHPDVGATKTLSLNETSAAFSDSSIWNNTAPTSSVFSLGNGGSTNGSGRNYIAYCFNSVAGYSSIGSYTGNGSASGPTVTTGFRPAFVIAKRTDSAISWVVFDNTRDPSNPVHHRLNPDTSSGEGTNVDLCDFTDTGFTITTSDAVINASGGTYIYMAFADTREAAFFKDVTTNGNHWTPVNLDYRDSLPDSPANNFAVMNPLDKDATWTLSEGNLKVSLLGVAGDNENIASTMAIPNSKLIYFEAKPNATLYGSVGVAKLGFAELNPFSVSGSTLLYLGGGGNAKIYVDASVVFDTGATWSLDILGVAVDMANSKVWFSKNGTYLGSGTQDPETNTGGFSISSDEVMPYAFKGNSNVTQSFTFNFGQDSTFAGAKPMGAYTDDSELGTFQYQPPAGFKSLCSQNLPEPEIIDGSEYFNTVLYTGNGSSRSITGVGFSPDWIWFKARNEAIAHLFFDSVRGATKYLQSNSTSAEGTGADSQTSFDSDGFSVGADTSTTGVNKNSTTYAAWNWLAGTAFSNDASATGVGTIDSSGQVNTKAGFSIVKHENGSGTRTVAHGLSSAPEIIFERKIDASGDWLVQFTVIDGTSDYMRLNTTVAKTNGSNALPTATVYSPYTGGGADVIAYCFHSVEGYSKVGSYTGNGNADGPFVYTGFRPAWILFKNTSTTTNWEIYDTTRQPSNAALGPLYANLSNAEESHATLPALDILSNGFKPRSTWAEFNTSGQTYIYLAFAETPFKYANAR